MPKGWIGIERSPVATERRRERSKIERKNAPMRASLALQQNNLPVRVQT
jgi:hypothetical protein